MYATIKVLNQGGRMVAFAYLLLFLASLTGCGPSPDQITIQTATAQTAIAALWTSAPTATSTQISTAIPSPTSTPTQAPTKTRTPKSTITPSAAFTQTPAQATPAGQRTSISVEEVTFSLIPLEGFGLVNDPDGPILIGPDFGPEGLAYIKFYIDTNEMAGSEYGLVVFAAEVQDGYTRSVKNLVQLGEDFPTADQPYFRWTIEDQDNGDEYHEVFYIFDSGKEFLIVIYSRPASAGEEYDELVDLAIQTLKFEQ